MKKTYMKPEITQEAVFEQHFLAGSNEGVDDGDSLGDKFNENDISYSNESNKLWDENESNSELSLTFK